MKYIVYIEKDDPDTIFIVDTSTNIEYIIDNDEIVKGTHWNLHIEDKSRLSFEKYIERIDISFYIEIEMDSKESLREVLPELFL